MDNRRELTRQLIADSFKALLQRQSFDKISIMNIADEAGIRRPSFYNHFQDKYDLLEWIASEELIAPALPFLEAGQPRAALCAVFSRVRTDAAFYRRAFAVTGQNGFPETVTARTEEALLRLPENEELPAGVSREELAHHSAVMLISTTRHWLETGRDGSAEDWADTYLYLVSHPFFQEEIQTERAGNISSVSPEK